MTKEKWNELKNQDPTWEALWEYYREQGGKLDVYSKFVEVFNHLDGKMVTNSMGGLVIIDIAQAGEKVRDYYNDKFKE